MRRDFLRLMWLVVLLFAVNAEAQVISKSASEAPPNRSEKPKISAQRAEELFQSVEEILKFVSEDSKLPIQHKVKRKLVNRDTVEKDLTERLRNDEDSQRMEHEDLVLKKFGFLQRGFDLRQFFIGMQR